jgi:hypothetical protein
MKLKIFFQFHSLSTFYLLDLVSIFLLLFILFKIIYEIRILFQFPPPSSFSSISFGSYFFNKHEKILISCF